MSSETDPAGAAKTREGLAVGLLAYLIWGFLPLLFSRLEGAGPVLAVAWRTLFALVVVAAVIGAMRGWAEVRAALADAGTRRAMLLSSVLLAINWLVYTYGVMSHRTIETSFGYYINPMLSVAIGMVLLGERQNRMQTLAIAVGFLALVLQAIGLGGVPLIALGVALSFGFYGYFRKTAKVGAAVGLLVETLLLAPVCVAAILVSGLGGWGWGFETPADFAVLTLTGPATAVPLLLFTFAIRRLRLTTMGMLQYLAPTIAFALAVLVLGETLNLTRLMSFALIWLSVAIYTADSLLRRR